MRHFNKIGVIGLGAVGGAVLRGFAPFYPVRGYDIDELKTVNTLEEVLHCEIIFLCLPTPAGPDGAADVSAIEEVLQQIVDSPTYRELPADPVFVLRSTVPVGTTTRLALKYHVWLVHCPEFLSARTADIDFLTSTRVILGAHGEVDWKPVEELFTQRFPGITVLTMPPEESEFVKYFLNSFYAAKVTFFNEMRQLSDVLALDWDDVMRGVLSSPWVEKMHTQVPGPDGQFGFGGACLPKDTQALAKMFQQNAVECLVLDAIIEQNARIRNNPDNPANTP
jgi:nucleotide sugar dehydrogenase